MHAQSADVVWTRIEALARAVPGGVIATDADGTLWTGDVGEDLFHAFVEGGRVEDAAREALGRDARDYAISDAGTGSDIARRLYAAYLEGRFPEERAYEAMTFCFAGWTRAAVRAFARGVVDQGGLSERMHGEVLEVLERARAVGIRTVIVSASPSAVVVEAASRVGFREDDVIAARARYCGEVMMPEVERPIPYATGKVTRLRERLGDGLPVYAAFGDNAFDIPLLMMAQIPVAVRPKPRLRAHAKDVPALVELVA
ncbi:MAG: haloacid dehalogenase-like hydrolase [Polyangiaceae bacterium]